MKFAYADPPYLGCCRLYDHFHGDDGRCWDRVSTHLALVERLFDEFPDGWALSLHEPSLPVMLQLCAIVAPTERVRVSPWVKPFASFKPNVNPAFAWEPALWRGGRDFNREQPTVRDYVSANITLRKGVPGAKPDEFSSWVFDLLNMQPEDEFVDLFPGSGLVTQAWEKFRNQPRLDKPNALLTDPLELDVA